MFLLWSRSGTAVSAVFLISASCALSAAMAVLRIRTRSSVPDALPISASSLCCMVSSPALIRSFNSISISTGFAIVFLASSYSAHWAYLSYLPIGLNS